MKKIVSFFNSVFSRNKSNGVAVEIKNYTDDLTAATSEFPDEELVAVISAAVQACMNVSSQSSLIIKSIRRSGQASPIWNKTGRLEHISRKF